MLERPMLSGKAPDDLSTLKFPLAVSPKLDGFRALVINGVVCSRNLKPIRNAHVQKLFGKPEYEGYDGELIVGDPTSPTCFRDTSSGVTRAGGEPDVRFFVFDRWDLEVTWRMRYADIHNSDRVIRVIHEIIVNSSHLLSLENIYLEQGYEGLMIRALEGPYKEGRSTTREGWLLKLKRFEDSDALVIGMEEKMHNGNEATINKLGHTERSSHQDNLVPMNTMGALIVRDVKTGVKFNIGTGFDDADRDRWWSQSSDWQSFLSNDGGTTRVIPERMSVVDTLIANPLFVKYKYFASGSKDKPRFPTYLGLRDKDDL